MLGVEPPRLPGKHIPSLDGLRAMSIMLVLLGHASDTVAWNSGASEYLRVILGNSRLGVLAFFVISGYLITHLLRRELESKGRISLRGFYFRRMLRIFPAFYIYLLVVTVLALAGIVTTRTAELLSAGTFTLNYWPAWHEEAAASSGYWFVGHFWTLSLEEQFYLLWPLTLVLLGLRRGKWLALGLIVLSPILRFATYILWPEARDGIPTMLHTTSDTIMVGCTMAIVQGKPWFEARTNMLVKGSTAAVAALFVLVLSPVLAERFAGAYTLPVGTTLDSLAVAVIILYVTRYSASFAGKILNSPPFVFVGVLSYSLYLWQQLFLTPLNQTWLGVFPLNLIVCFVVAILSYRLIEKPFLRLKERRLRKLAQPGTTISEVQR